MMSITYNLYLCVLFKVSLITLCSSLLVMLVYMNDMIFTKNNVKELNVVKNNFNNNFGINNLGRLCFFLGLELCPSTNGMYLTKKMYYLSLHLKMKC